MESDYNHSHEVKSETKEVDETVEDLVCGMDVDPNNPAATSEYEGKTYYFCAPGCKKKFDENPEKYIK